MNLLQATNKQLYQLANDECLRMKDRYAATRELQERKKKNALCRNRSSRQNRLCSVR